MEDFFATMLEDVKHERSIILLLSIIDPDILDKANLPMME